jgi:hypothetical protein
MSHDPFRSILNTSTRAKRARANPLCSPDLRTAALALLLCGLHLPQAQAQSDALSRQSGASLAASVEVPVVVVSALAEGAAFAITGVAISGATAAITVSAVGVGASFVVVLSAEALAHLGMKIGDALQAVAVGGGWLLYAGSAAICYVADETARAHIRSREIDV